MTVPPHDAVVAAFRGPKCASRVGGEVVAVNEAAALIRTEGSELQITESHHMAKIAVVGLTDAVIGLIGGPMVWAAVGGAPIGALANRLRDTGFQTSG